MAGQEPVTTTRPAGSGLEIDDETQAAPLAPWAGPPPRQARATVLPPEDQHPPLPPGSQTQAFERQIVFHSAQVDKLFAAFAKAQGKFQSVERTRTARVESRKEGGRSYQYEYETLADVIEATREAMAENGLGCMQFPFTGRSSVTIRTMITHESGQFIGNDLMCTTDGMGPQQVASGITYLCRYSRKAIHGIAGEFDDDGAAAQQAPPRGVPQAGQRRSQQPPQNEYYEAAPPSPSRDGRDVTRTPQHAANGATIEHAGVLARIEDRANGTMAELEDGFAAAATSEELRKALRAFDALTPKPRLFMVCRAPRRPGMAPVITEMDLAHGEGQ